MDCDLFDFTLQFSWIDTSPRYYPSVSKTSKAGGKRSGGFEINFKLSLMLALLEGIDKFELLEDLISSFTLFCEIYIFSSLASLLIKT